MTGMKWGWILLLATFLEAPLWAAENLKLNQHLDYSSDSQDGPLITGDDLDDGVVAGKPAYVIIYGEGCFNSKRQARRTVELYEKYRGRVQFVVVDMDKKHSAAQDELVRKFYKGYIPHVVVLNREGAVVYDASGEVDSGKITNLLDKALATEFGGAR
jgi:thioredoxin-like negative regulator of GroEL